jgi:hypothetical protein
MPPLVSLHGEQARQSTFPPGSKVYISADPQQHSISTKTTILAAGEVVSVMLRMGKPGQLDLFYKVEVKGFLDKDEKRTELITESRLRFLNGSPVTVTVDLKHGDGKHCVDGIVLGYCDIPPTDDRRKCSGNEEFWYSVQLLDNPNINVIRIMHEVSNSQLAYRPPATPALRESAEKGDSCVKEEMDLDIIPTQTAMGLESSKDTECSMSGGGADFIATTSQSLNEINNAASSVKVEFDAAYNVQTRAPQCDVTMHTDFAPEVTLHQAHEPDNDPTKRKTSRESYQPLNEIHEIDFEVPSERLKSFPNETKKMPVQRKILASEELENSEQVELDPNKVLGICDLENTLRQKITAREEPSQEKVRIHTHEETWNQRLKELHEYKRNFGDCLVPTMFPSNPVLARWVLTQRTEYKYLQDGQRTFLTSERLRLLEGVGFVWNADAYKWNRKLQELELFIEMNGHHTVPQKSNTPLYIWIRRQKSEYKKYLNKETTQMNGEKVLLLQNAGLQLEMAENKDDEDSDHEGCNFHTQDGTPAKTQFHTHTQEEIWNLRLKELHEYKQNFGNCLVPSKFPSNPVLAGWVNVQRTQYKCLQDGQRTRLTSERLRLLEVVGFVWSLSLSNRNRKLEVLKVFIEMEGHTNVPAGGKYKSLSQWIIRQKSEYKKYLNKEKTQMNGEKVLLLQNAGLQLE